ncbi:ATP-binding protein [Geobacter sp.]|uniref:ATP-binding protein n=1 Tax=Geobacter sp. TaxID=46610 RepID=UPI002610826D|nr:ATP-binding protein [Geobacter sp.]
MKTLIVDDKADDRKLLRMNLERRGCEVIEAADGESALALAQEHRPRLIISDALLPRMDGFQLLRSIRSDASLRDTPFVFYTAVYTAPKDEELAHSLGADAYIAKPVEPEKFWQELQTILEGCRLKKLRRDVAMISEEEYLRRYGEVVATKLEEKYHELLENEAMLRLVMETLPVGVWIIDHDGLILRSNPAGEKIWGGARYVGMERYGEYRGWWADTGKRIEPHEWGAARAVTKGETSLDEVIEIEAFDGRRKTILHSAVPLRDQMGRIVGAIVVNQDITERKRAENEVRRLNEELEARVAERTRELEGANRELQAFNFSISHDLRAPLIVIDGFVKAVLEDYADRLNETGVDYLGRVRSACQRMGQLVDALLSLSRLTRESLNLKEVDLSGIARSVMQEFSHLDPERAVTVRIAEGVTALGDQQLLRSVMENLLGNAWKYTARREGAEIEFGAMEEGGNTVYFVRDNGVGFDMTYADRLFVPFQRLHRADEFKGTGIGLATVQRIVLRHGGRVWAEAQPDRGATFYFTLGMDDRKEREADSGTSKRNS